MKPKPPKTPLKAIRKGSREAEIEMHGHPLPKHKVHQSKKTYSRVKAKASLKIDRSFPSVSAEEKEKGGI